MLNEYWFFLLEIKSVFLHIMVKLFFVEREHIHMFSEANFFFQLQLYRAEHMVFVYKQLILTNRQIGLCQTLKGHVTIVMAA